MTAQVGIVWSNIPLDTLCHYGDNFMGQIFFLAISCCTKGSASAEIADRW